VEGRPDNPSLLFPSVCAGKYACDQGYNIWRLRGTPDWLLIFTVGGAGQFSHPHGTLTSKRGELVLYKPYAHHHYATASQDEPWKLLWAHFKPPDHWRQWLSWPEQNQSFGHIRAREPAVIRKIERGMHRMLQLANSSVRLRQELAMNALESVLMWAHTVVSGDVQIDERLSRAADFIAQHATEKLTLQRIAAATDQSVSRLSHLFPRQYGYSPLEYAEHHRIHHSLELITNPDLSFQQIAEAVGFASPFYFSRRFRKATGYSPREYRKMLPALVEHREDRTQTWGFNAADLRPLSPRARRKKTPSK
jgi:AraC family transcriptional regulator of arabinose operon